MNTEPKPQAAGVEVPPGTTQRVTFTVGPGTYTFFCSPHPGMQGQLVAG